jgi:hypothetical protein
VLVRQELQRFREGDLVVGLAEEEEEEVVVEVVLVALQVVLRAAVDPGVLHPVGPVGLVVWEADPLG